MSGRGACCGCCRVVVKTKPRWWLLAAALVVSLGTARLGWWQLDRATQKTQLQQLLDAQRQLPALQQKDLELASEESLTSLFQRRVHLKGQWLAEYTVYLDNRPMMGRTGFFAVTPLLLDDGAAVLVQRGWLPRNQLDRTRIQATPLPAGTVVVQGRLAPALSRTFELPGQVAEPAEPSNTAGVAIRQNLDVAAFAQAHRLRLKPWVAVQEDAPGVEGAVAVSSSDGLLRQWAAPATGVEKHHGYAFQWFALSALSAGLWLWFEVVQPRRSSRARPSSPSADAIS